MLALGSSAWAQLPAPPTQYTPTIHDWPGDNWFGVGSYKKSVVLNMDDDPRPDVVTLRGTTAVYTPTAATYEAFLRMADGVTVNDLCVLPGYLADGRDAVALVGPAGIHVVWWDLILSAFQLQHYDDAAWYGATHVRSHDMDDDSLPDLVGLAAGGGSLLLRHQLTSGSFAATTSMATLSTALDFEPMQWDSDPELELAVDTQAGLFVHDWAEPIPLQFLRSTFLNNALTILREPGQGEERFAWVTGTPGGGDQALIVGGSAGTDAPVLLGTTDVRQAEAGDMDDDDDDDLVLSLQDSWELWVLQNFEEVSLPFNVGSSGGVNLNSLPGALGAAVPAVGELDGYPGAEVVYPTTDGAIGRLYVYDAPLIAGLGYSSSGGLQEGDCFLGCVLTTTEYDNGHHERIGVHIQTDGGPGSLLSIETKIWRRADPLSFTESTAVAHCSFLPSEMAASIPCPSQAGGSGEYFLELPVLDSQDHAGYAHYLEIVAHYAGQGPEGGAATQTQIIAFAFGFASLLPFNPTGDTADIETIDGEWCFDQSGNPGVTIGDVVRGGKIRRVPRFDPNVPPSTSGASCGQPGPPAQGWQP